MAEIDRLLSKAETAYRLKGSVSTVDRLMRTGELKSETHGRRVGFRLSEVQRYMTGTWDEYWRQVDRIAAGCPLPTGAVAARLGALMHSGANRTPSGPAPKIVERVDW